MSQNTYMRSNHHVQVKNVEENKNLYRTLQCITHTFFTQKTILEVQCVLCIGTQKFGIFFINFARSRKPITNLLLSQKHIDSHLDQGFLFLVCFVMICLVKSIPNSIIYSILNPKHEICESIFTDALYCY